MSDCTLSECNLWAWLGPSLRLGAEQEHRQRPGQSVAPEVESDQERQAAEEAAQRLPSPSGGRDVEVERVVGEVQCLQAG